MNRAPQQRRAFTLIEVALVVLLFGTLAGVAAMSFARPLRAARVREAVAEIAAFDAAARQLARRTGRAVEFEIDTYEQRLARAGAELHLPRGVRIEQARQASDAPGGSPLTIRVAPHGWSRSYALRVVGPDYDRWLLVSGMSGQVSVVQDESNVEDILARATRRDAD